MIHSRPKRTWKGFYFHVLYFCLSLMSLSSKRTRWGNKVIGNEEYNNKKKRVDMEKEIRVFQLHVFFFLLHAFLFICLFVFIHVFCEPPYFMPQLWGPHSFPSPGEAGFSRGCQQAPRRGLRQVLSAYTCRHPVGESQHTQLPPGPRLSKTTRHIETSHSHWPGNYHSFW